MSRPAQARSHSVGETRTDPGASCTRTSSTHRSIRTIPCSPAGTPGRSCPTSSRRCRRRSSSRHSNEVGDGPSPRPGTSCRGRSLRRRSRRSSVAASTSTSRRSADSPTSHPAPALMTSTEPCSRPAGSSSIRTNRPTSPTTRLGLNVSPRQPRRSSSGPRSTASRRITRRPRTVERTAAPIDSSDRASSCWSGSCR